MPTSFARKTSSPLARLASLWSRPSDRDLISAIRTRSNGFQTASDGLLLAAAHDLRNTVRGGRGPLDPNIAVPGAALVVEAARRVLGVTLFDQQILAGLTLARGKVAEMATGEGKTLAALVPELLFSLGGHGVHVATPSAYLAARDCRTVTPVLELLGVSVGLVPDGGSQEEKRQAYACDVAYATGYELGFDYLRDRLQGVEQSQQPLGSQQRAVLLGETAVEQRPTQPRRAAAIIDEIDSVLIDEAGLPLVLSDAPYGAAMSTEAYELANRIADLLMAPDHYRIEPNESRVVLTVEGSAKVYEWLETCPNLPIERRWASYVEQALAAKHLHSRDVDYIVCDGRVMIVDEYTGRIFTDRTWRDGLQQAVECKEGVAITPELRSTARISRQRYFKLYEIVCGMSGTAIDCRDEFWSYYRLPVETIALRRPSRRLLLPTRFFRDSAAKLSAVATEVADAHANGRPVLVGSRTIENSQAVAQSLQKRGIAFQLLNGKQDQSEAEVIAQAGQRGAVTVATNMAGRGTDIVLGAGVAALGGLHVIGVERHESRRIDRQLVGRAARQGDPGSARFFVSADDSLLRRFDPALCQRMQTMDHHGGEILADISRDVARAQSSAETAARTLRRQVLDADDWLDAIGKALGQ